MISTLSTWMLPAGPVIAAGVAAISWHFGLPTPAALCAFVALVCALWWIFETLDVAIVGLLPLVALPGLGILDHRTVAASYGHTMILLLMGGFFLSAAMERSGAHRRIALSMVQAVGGRGGKRIVLGFMLAAACLSMWISNAATTLMMLPIALAVLSSARDPSLRTPLLLGIAYSASVGGMATPIGTPPNIVFTGYMQETLGIEIGFFDWMKFGLPIVLVMLPIIWLWVTRNLGAGAPIEMPPIGRWRPSERRVMVIFTITALLWIFRTGPWGGWSSWVTAWQNGSDAIDPITYVSDTTIALAASFAMFVCPRGDDGDVPSDGDSDPTSLESASSEPASFAQSRLLDWETAVKIPWGILIMFGGGLALASGFQETGLSVAIGNQLSFVAGAPPWVVVAAVCLLVNFLTEITSSTATSMLMMPILGTLAITTGLPPELILIPGTISCSCAFMLPVATAPNVIVFGAGGLRTEEMARNGFVLNLIAAMVIVSAALLLLYDGGAS